MVHSSPLRMNVSSCHAEISFWSHSLSNLLNPDFVTHKNVISKTTCRRVCFELLVWSVMQTRDAIWTVSGLAGWGAASYVKNCDFLRLKNAEHLDQQGGRGQASSNVMQCSFAGFSFI